MRHWKPGVCDSTDEKRRRQRRQVHVPAAMRGDGGPTRAIVRDISRGGLLLEVSPTPSLGSYVEVIHKGRSVVARVMWCGGRFAGVKLQDEVNVDLWVAGLRESPEPAAQVRPVRAPQKPCADEEALARDQSRQLQFLCLVGFGMLMAVVATVILLNLWAEVAAQLPGASN